MARAREVADLLDQFALYTLLPCACGMRIKVPPEFKRDQVECPRCQRVNLVPTAAPVAEQSASGEPGHNERSLSGEARTTGDSNLEYTRRDDGWDAFRCACGQTIQLGPGFPLDYTVCGKCDRRIELRGRK
jgi:heat shock protein HtpX